MLRAYAKKRGRQAVAVALPKPEASEALGNQRLLVVQLVVMIDNRLRAVAKSLIS